MGANYLFDSENNVANIVFLKVNQSFPKFDKQCSEIKFVCIDLSLSGTCAFPENGLSNKKGIHLLY